MITVITGLPGNGKTLYTLWYVKAYAEKENREVFYSGIKDLRLPWTEIKSEEWALCPPGAIIVIDEAQFVFPKKPNGSNLPEFYQKLAVHRHSGYDIFIITQHPGLVDNFVKNLCGRHLHVIRKFGMQRANVWEWAAANTSPEKAASHKNAVLHKFGYPKEVYDYYKSAEVHTVKRSIPMKLILVVLFVLAVIVIFFYVMNRLREKGSTHAKSFDSSVGAVAAPAASNAAGKFSYLDQVADAKQYIFEHTPRVEGLPQTAPRYDEVMKPITAPVPSACVESRAKGCKCYSQQGTFIQMPAAICHDIVERGYFMDFDDKGGHAQQASSGSQTGLTAVRSDAVPFSAVAQSQNAPAAPPVVVADASKSSNAADGYGLLGKVGKGVKKREYD